MRNWKRQNSPPKTFVCQGRQTSPAADCQRCDIYKAVRDAKPSPPSRTVGGGANRSRTNLLSSRISCEDLLYLLLCIHSTNIFISAVCSLLTDEVFFLSVTFHWCEVDGWGSVWNLGGVFPRSTPDPNPDTSHLLLGGFSGLTRSVKGAVWVSIMSTWWRHTP